MKKNKKNVDKRKIITLIAMIVIIIILAIIVGILEDSVEKGNNSELGIAGYQNIEQLLNQYECKLIKETKSSDKEYSKDIYVEFKYNTFEKNESKRRYYENIISAVAGFLNESYRLIDKNKDLLIEVQRKTNLDGKNYYIYAVNGVEEYFKKNESQIALKTYKEDEIVNLNINTNIIKNLMQNDWEDVDFGSKDSSFEKYDIYFDEGIEVRKISGKVYNVVFTNKYEQEIVNKIKVGTNFEEIIQKLGEPIFGSKEEKLIGYKNNDIYVFFLEDAISIYRNEKIDTKQFEEILVKYINKEIDIKEFMNELTYLWSDYEQYNYTSSYIYINYPNKGIEIEMNSDSPSGIKIYKNYNNLDNVKKYIEEAIITSDLKTDLFYSREYKKQLEKEQREYEYMTSDEYNMLNTFSNLYYCCVKNNNINLLSKDTNIPNKTININPNSIFWYSDTVLVYSINNKGIYYYDLNTDENKIIVEGKENFEIERYENQKIIYDNGKEINI